MFDPNEVGTCDTCDVRYPLGSRDGRCGDCGNCAACCDHPIDDGQDTRELLVSGLLIGLDCE